jgi:hypothetical protein
MSPEIVAGRTVQHSREIRLPDFFAGVTLVEYGGGNIFYLYQTRNSRACFRHPRHHIRCFAMRY